MNTTTLETIAADFAAVIRGTTPDFPLHEGDLWQGPVPTVESVPVPARRTFFCQWELDGEDFAEDGVYGSGVEHGVVLRVFTSYVGLPEDGVVVSAMIVADRRQLWMALQERVDPVVPGLVAVASPTWEYALDGDEPGHIWGAHVFRVRYLIDAD